MTEDGEGGASVMKHLSNLLHWKKAARRGEKEVEKRKRTCEKVIRVCEQENAAKSAQQPLLV